MCSKVNRFHPNQCSVVQFCLLFVVCCYNILHDFLLSSVLFFYNRKQCVWVCVCRHWPETYLCWCHGCIPQLQSGSVTVCRRCCAGFCCWVPAKGKHIIHHTTSHYWPPEQSTWRAFSIFKDNNSTWIYIGAEHFNPSW